MKVVFPDPWEWQPYQLKLPRSREAAIAKGVNRYLPLDDATGAFQSCDQEHRSERIMPKDGGDECCQCRYLAGVARGREKAARRREEALKWNERIAQKRAERATAAERKRKLEECERIEAEKVKNAATVEEAARLLGPRLKWAAPFVKRNKPLPTELERPPRIIFDDEPLPVCPHWVESYGRVRLHHELRRSRAAG